tara:strand:+ start:316 stop:1248 length:933 start_codon:yes stop_codon:yes gene_type:complete
MNTQHLAPILLFAYNRPDHFKKTIKALKKNKLASLSHLIIHCDGKKNKDDRKVDLVVKIAKSVQGFKKIQVIVQKKNLGLKKSIILNVSKFIKKHKKLIILEDDMVTSKAFLNFMNSSLIYFQNKKKIWHISGHSHFNINNKKDIYFSTYMNCWGWATWEDRWKNLDINTKRIFDTFNSDRNLKTKFDISKFSKFSNQIEDNYNKKINTWAVFWHWTIFKYKKLCVNPSKTFVQNIGRDGSGIHKDISFFFKIDLNNKLNYKLKIKILENKLFKTKLKNFYDSEVTFSKKLIGKIYRILIKFYNFLYDTK